MTLDSASVHSPHLLLSSPSRYCRALTSYSQTQPLSLISPSSKSSLTPASNVTFPHRSQSCSAQNRRELIACGGMTTVWEPRGHWSGCGFGGSTCPMRVPGLTGARTEQPAAAAAELNTECRELKTGFLSPPPPPLCPGPWLCCPLTGDECWKESAIVGGF